MSVIVKNDALINICFRQDEKFGVASHQAVLNAAVVFNDQNQILPHISAFLTEKLKQGKYSQLTVKTYARNLFYFYKYLSARPEFESLRLDEAFLVVQKHVLVEYFAELKQVGRLSSSTIRNRDATLQMFFKDYLCAHESHRPVLRRKNPYLNGLLSPAPKTRLVKACSILEVKHLMECSSLERERALLQFIFDSGLRRSEVGRITVEDIDAALNIDGHQTGLGICAAASNSEYAPLLVKGSKGRNGETKPRYTLVTKETLIRIKRYHGTPLFKKYALKISPKDPIPAFFNADGRPYTAKCISKLLETVSKRAITKKKIKVQISPHKLRHGIAYVVLQSPDHGVDPLDRLVLLQKMLGHSNLDTTEMYTRIPHEIIADMRGGAKSNRNRAELMRELTKETSLKIKATDKK